MAGGRDAPSIRLIGLLNPGMSRLGAAAEGLVASDKPMSAQHVVDINEPDLIEQRCHRRPLVVAEQEVIPLDDQQAGVVPQRDRTGHRFLNLAAELWPEVMKSGEGAGWAKPCRPG